MFSKICEMAMTGKRRHSGVKYIKDISLPTNLIIKAISDLEDRNDF